MMIRSFIAIELKDQETIKNLISYTNRLKQNQDKMKAVEPENLHMTIKFLGNIDESLVPKIYNILNQEVNQKMFQGKNREYLLKGVGQFNKFSVIWTKLNGEIHFLQNIKDKTDELLYNGLKIERDKRTEFTPHLTIGRLKNNKINYKTFDTFKKLINENKNLVFGPFNINQIKLKKSTLTPKGPIYSDLVY